MTDKRYFEPVTPISIADFMEHLDKPNLLQRIRRLDPVTREQLILSIKQFDRAESGDRIRPDLLPDAFGFKKGETSMPENNYSSVDRPFGWAKPYSARETYRPDMTEADKAKARDVSQRLSTELAVEDMQARFRDSSSNGIGTDADRPVDTSPPTLRETLESAVRQVSE